MDDLQAFIRSQEPMRADGWLQHAKSRTWFHATLYNHAYVERMLDPNPVRRLTFKLVRIFFR